MWNPPKTKRSNTEPEDGIATRGPDLKNQVPNNDFSSWMSYSKILMGSCGVSQFFPGVEIDILPSFEESMMI